MIKKVILGLITAVFVSGAGVAWGNPPGISSNDLIGMTGFIGGFVPFSHVADDEPLIQDFAKSPTLEVRRGLQDAVSTVWLGPLSAVFLMQSATVLPRTV
jgi:hypothetical protein